jgi:hypothetical protein
MKTTPVCLFAWCAALALSAGVALRADPQKTSASVVQVTAEADKPDADGQQTVTVTLAIDKGWHLYANPTDNAELKENQTVVKVQGKGKPEVVKIEYPPGKAMKDKLVGDYKIYEGKVAIKATVRRAKGDTEPLEVSVYLRADNDKACLLGDTARVSVPYAGRSTDNR